MHNLNLTDINTLLFDLGNVIINIQEEQPWWDNVFAPNFHQEAIQKLEKKDFFGQFDKGLVSTPDFLQTLNEISIHNLSEQEIINIWNSKLLDLPPHRVKLLEKLKKKHSIFLLSNTNDIHIQWVDEYVFQTFGYAIFKELFDGCVYSHQVALKKPDREIYAKTHQVVGEVPADSILFFDDIESNVEGAKAYGFQAFCVKNDISDFLK